jgi:hypothetical protein
VTTVETSAEVVSTTGEAALTTIVSAVPARSVKSRSARWPSCRRKSRRDCGAKPLSSAVTLYTPACSAGM